MTTLVISDIIKSIRDLPSLPAVVVELLGNLDQEDTSTKRLGEKIAQDQALAAKTLRLANSSFYGMQCKVTTIPQAIAVLGFNSVRTLVTAAAVVGNFSAAAECDFDFKIFWRQSIATALCAKTLARHKNVNQDHAFMAGLLHDIGRLVLVTHSPKLYAEVLAHRAAQDCSVFEAERAILGLDHTMVGRALAEYWKFPLPMQKAIENHHISETQEKGSLAALIFVADSIAYALDLCGDDDAMVPPVPSITWNGLNLEKDIVMNIFSETESQFEETCQILVS